MTRSRNDRFRQGGIRAARAGVRGIETWLGREYREVRHRVWALAGPVLGVTRRPPRCPAVRLGAGLDIAGAYDPDEHEVFISPDTLFADETTRRAVMAHEACHELLFCAGLDDGHGDGHGRTFRRACRAVGIPPTSCLPVPRRGR